MKTKVYASVIDNALNAFSGREHCNEYVLQWSYWFSMVTAIALFYIMYTTGYYYTSDWAYCDSDGNYRITGRAGDAIRTQVAWLNVPEIERLMVGTYKAFYFAYATLMYIILYSSF